MNRQWGKTAQQMFLLFIGPEPRRFHMKNRLNPINTFFRTGSDRSRLGVNRHYPGNGQAALCLQEQLVAHPQ